MSPCYWCANAVVDCPRCYGEFSKMPNCVKGAGTGCLCENGCGVRWQGTEPCPSEHEESVDNWIRYHIRDDPWEDGPTAANLPWRDMETLTYVAFMADLNVMYQSLQFTSQGAAAVGWLTRCRNAAVEAGGRAPRVLRAGPLPDSVQSLGEQSAGQ
jgi:hypothetical protein